MSGHLHPSDTIEAQGPGEAAPTLVLLPGLAGHEGEFAQQAAAFEPGRRVITLAPFVDGDLSTQARARRVLGAVRDQQAGRFVLLGHSVCGMVALEVARTRPADLAGAVVLDSAVLVPAPMRAVLRLPLLLLRTPLASRLLEWFFAATFTPSDPPAFRAEVLARLEATPLRARRTITRANFTYDAARALRAAAVPVLVVRANIPTPFDRLPARVSRAEVRDVGHWPHVRAPQSVNAALDGFLSTVDAAGGSGAGRPAST